ncbi:ACT domain-containing protein [Patescibacteria group bacterium]|nr:ACT domain-containing protein [Patescibacteria group bacterium]
MKPDLKSPKRRFFDMVRDMKPDLKEIINKSLYRIVPGGYIYAKVSSIPDIDNCFLISKDADEITVIVEESKYSRIGAIERNKELYALIELRVSVPFYAVGFLAAVTNAIAEKGMNVLVVSTYSKDYILVRKEHENDTIKVLDTMGFRKSDA